MKTTDLLTALRRMRVETGSLVCLGCGHEHNCGVYGCALLREAEKQLYALDHAADHLRKQRNAALGQLKRIAACETCKNNQPDGADDGRCTACLTGQGWKWNGGKKENT